MILVNVWTVSGSTPTVALVGDGPLTSVRGWRQITRLNGAGSFKFQCPATDKRANDLLMVGRWCGAWMARGGTLVYVGGGPIESVIQVHDGNGTVMLEVAGGDPLRDLAFRNVENFAVTASTTAHSDILTNYGGPWTNLGELNTETAISFQWSYETVLDALKSLASKLGEYWRYPDYPTGPFMWGIEWIGSDAEFDHCGIVADAQLTPAAIEGRTDRALITSLARVNDAAELRNVFYVFGAGEGAKRLTLAAATASPPAGWVLDTVASTLTHTASVATYGERSGVLTYKDIVALDGTLGAQQAAANLLLQAAIAEAGTLVAPTEHYQVAVTGTSARFAPGDIITVRAENWCNGDQVISIDADLYMLDVDWSLDTDGTEEWSLLVGNVVRYPVDDVAVIVAELQQSRQMEAYVQVASGSGSGMDADTVDGQHASAFVTASTLDANTVLYATVDNTPAALALAASTFPARASTGNIVAKAISDDALLFLAAANDAAMRTELGLGTMATETAANYALLAGRAGGQTLYGGTAASERLTLYGSSDVTDGGVYVPTRAGVGNVPSTVYSLNIRNNTNGEAGGVYVQKTVNAADSQASSYGAYVNMTDAQDKATAVNYGMYVAYANSGGAKSQCYAIRFANTLTTASNTTAAYAMRLDLDQSGNGTITTGAAIYLRTLKNAGAITTAYGIWIDAVQGSTTAYGIKISDIATATTNYAIYTGTGAVRLGDAVTCQAGLIVNNAGGNAATDDFRAASDTETNMLWLDASADVVYIGGSSNGVQIAKGGDVTLLGTAKYERHIQIPAMSTGTPANQPTEVDFYTAGGLQFPTTGSKYSFCQWEIPDDWDGTDIYFEVDWMPDSGATSGADAVRWSVEYRAIAEGELINNGTSAFVYNDISGAGAGDTTDYSQYKTKHSRMTLTYNNANQPLAKQDHIYFKVTRDTGVANDFGGSVTVLAYEIIYTSTGFPAN